MLIAASESHHLFNAVARTGSVQAQAWQAQMMAMYKDDTLLRIDRQYLPVADVVQLLDF